MIINCFIFARGGSKGLPRKNIKELCGEPLIAYSIKLAIKSDFFQNIFVSTDDSEIEKVSKQYGAKVIKRPGYLSTDNSPEIDSWKHAIDYVERNYGNFDEFVSLPATSPLRNKEDIHNAILKRRQDSADICISITESGRSPYFNMVEIDNEGKLGLVIPSGANYTRRQDCPKVYDITTSVYSSTTDYIKKTKALLDGKISYIKIPKERAIDIDDIYDFCFAEAILEMTNNK